MSKNPIMLIGAAISKHLRMREAASRLEALDDRMLADIGISRSEVRRAVIFGRAIR
jgi:uncharacterized protein YjiS (DUF1127 family)